MVEVETKFPKKITVREKLLTKLLSTQDKIYLKENEKKDYPIQNHLNYHS